MTPTYTGRSAMVTGADRGLGAAIARTLAADGCYVALIEVDEAAFFGLTQETETSWP